MRTKIATIAATAALVLAGCGQPLVGEVTDKRYDAERRWTVDEPTYRQECTTRTVPGSGTTKSTTKETCKRVKTGTKQVQKKDDADYTLIVTTDDGQVREREVDRAEYDATQVGDRYGEDDQ